MESILYNQYQVFFQTAGDPQNPCIVCCHPAFGDHRVFDDQLFALSKHFFLIAPDMLGHGKTQPKSTKDQVNVTPAHIRAILDFYKIRQCHLLGVSLGALMVQAFDDLFPQQVLSVCAVGGYSIHKNNQKLQKAQNREIFSWVFKLMFNMDAFRSTIAQKSTYQPSATQRFKTYTQAFTRKSMMVMQGAGKIFKTKDTPVTYPLLIVYGEHELELALEHGKTWVQMEPTATLKIIPDAGHCANMENPQEFNHQYLQFLGKCA